MLLFWNGAQMLLMVLQWLKPQMVRGGTTIISFNKPPGYSSRSCSRGVPLRKRCGRSGSSSSCRDGGRERRPKLGIEFYGIDV
jgi:hypothetical protein